MRTDPREAERYCVICGAREYTAEELATATAFAAAMPTGHRKRGPSSNGQKLN
jgi:hypothetical protein